MCGLIGWSLRSAPDRRQCRRLAMLRRILISHAILRGTDSWGCVQNGVISRGIGSMARAVFDRHVGQHFLAHTRYATCGSKALSHPIIVDDLIGMHNGQVLNHAELNKTYNRKCVIDSEHIFHHVHFGDDLSELDGWGAVQMYYADRPDKVFLAGDPLHVARTRWGLFWLSTDDVYSALDLVNLSSYEVTIDYDWFTMVLDGDRKTLDMEFNLNSKKRKWYYDDKPKGCFADGSYDAWGDWDSKWHGDGADKTSGGARDL